MIFGTKFNVDKKRIFDASTKFKTDGNVTLVFKFDANKASASKLDPDESLTFNRVLYSLQTFKSNGKNLQVFLFDWHEVSFSVVDVFVTLFSILFTSLILDSVFLLGLVSFD